MKKYEITLSHWRALLTKRHFTLQTVSDQAKIRSGAASERKNYIIHPRCSWTTVTRVFWDCDRVAIHYCTKNDENTWFSKNKKGNNILEFHVAYYGYMYRYGISGYWLSSREIQNLHTLLLSAMNMQRIYSAEVIIKSAKLRNNLYDGLHLRVVNMKIKRFPEKLIWGTQ